MKVSDAIIKCLENEGVNTIFGYPGGAVLPLYNSLKNCNIKHILVRNEQSLPHYASGYSRVSKKTGVCISTSGPGATNLITGIATAYMDSIPLVVITGQVKSNCIGKDVFQEADIIGATTSFTKHNYLIKDAKELPRIIKESFHIASTGRPGPVLIDIPVDIQNQDIQLDFPKDINIIGYKPTYKGHIGQIKKALKKIKTSKRPLICAGGGVLSSDACKELNDFVEKSKIPVVNTLMGIGSLSYSSPYYIGIVGSHGHSFSNKIVDEADLLIIIGARVADRVTSGFNKLSKCKDIIHIDIDPAEVKKNIDTNIPIIGDVKVILQEFINLIKPIENQKWLNTICEHKKNYKTKKLYNNNFVNPKKALKFLSDSLNKNDEILVADVGQNQIWSAHSFDIKGNRRFLTSGGLGTMGYSIPAAIGSKIACQNRRVISVVGDGGAQMSLCELATISENNLKMIILLFNNNRLGMVRELQYNAYGENSYFGIDFKFNPDFIQIANSYNLNTKKVCSNHEFEETLKEAIASDTSYLIECIVDPNFSTL
ncbi:biosynthetic-type acetolactate synthase large subunit [Tepidibacter sp. Z1-5]|uniref:biosynthetic-type acetolactate synthase large subunit n=1 Tax=Tepidibacter sp. Z1-5 TaxID=3134138 RepID=UPI0030C3CC36